MEKSLSQLKEAVLEKKVIEVKPIERRKPYLKKNHDGHHTYTGCHKGFTLYYDTERRAYRSPFKEREDGVDEQEAFEKLLNQKEGSLNLYDYSIHKENFWGKFEVKIPKNGIKLNLTNPADALRYRILLVDPKFAKETHEIGILEKQYQIVSEEDIKEQVTELSKKKDKAQDIFFKIKKSRKEMINALRLLGKNPNPDSELEFLRSQLFDIVENTTVARGVVGLDRFLEVMQDPTKTTKLFVLDLIQNNHIIKTDLGFKVNGSDVFLGTNYVEVVRYFLKDDPINREQRQLLEEKLRVS